VVVEVEPISCLKTEDGELRVPIEDSHIFPYEVLRRGGWMALQESMAVERAVTAANQAALAGWWLGGGDVRSYVGVD